MVPLTVLPAAGELIPTEGGWESELLETVTVSDAEEEFPALS